MPLSLRLPLSQQPGGAVGLSIESEMISDLDVTPGATSASGLDGWSPPFPTSTVLPTSAKCRALRRAGPSRRGPYSRRREYGPVPGPGTRIHIRCVRVASRSAIIAHSDNLSDVPSAGPRLWNFTDREPAIRPG